MKRTQAVALLCVPYGTEDKLGMFLENNLSLYSYNIESVPEIIRTLFNEGPAREAIFAKIDSEIGGDPNAKILIFSDLDLSGVRKLELFQHDKDSKEQFEMFLRHLVSILHARYKNITVEVYTPIDKEPFYKQLI